MNFPAFHHIKKLWINKFLICVCYSLFTIHYSLADDCTQFKVTPNVVVGTPAWTKSVGQPAEPMNLLHGNVVATLVEGYNLQTQAVPVAGGYCVLLSGVDAVVGYSDFLIQIDERHEVGSCAYNATLNHEYEHIRSHLGTIDASRADIKSAVTRAANSIMPVFVPADGNLDAALDTMQAAMQNHPDIILMKQKIAAVQEINDHAVDQRDNGSRIKACMDK